VNLGPGSFFRLANHRRFTRHQSCNTALWISQISRHDRSRGTHDSTCRFSTGVDTVTAIITFRRGPRLRVDIDGVVRTGLHARFAANAPPGIKIDDGILANGEAGCGANFHTGSICTVIASQNMEGTLCSGMDPFFQILDPGLVDPDRIRVLGLASHCAGVATDATSVVDHKSIGGVSVGSHGVEFTLGKAQRPSVRTVLTGNFSTYKFRPCQFLTLQA